jgi:hypothetical protein
MKKTFIRTLKIIGAGLLIALLAFSVFHLQDNKADAATISTDGKTYSWTDSGGYLHRTAKLVMDKTLIYCYDEDLEAPNGGKNYDDGSRYHNASVNSLLYYGYGGDGYSGDNSMTDYVKTWVALSNWKSGQRDISKNTPTPSNRDPFIKSLIQHAIDKDMPDYDISFSKGDVTSSIVNGNQQSDPIKLNGTEGKGEANLFIPQYVTIHVSDGRTKTNGNITVKAGQTFYFTAPLDYNSNFVTGDVNGWRGQLASILYLSDSPKYQDGLETPTLVHDPKPVAGFTVHFWARQRQLTVRYIDSWTHAIMWQDPQVMVTIGAEYDKSQYPNNFERDGHVYKFNSFNGYGDQLKENMPNHDVTLDIIYDPYNHSRVYYKDKATGKELKEHNDDLIKVGDHYEYHAPQSIEKDGKTYDLEGGENDPPKKQY